MIGPWVGLFRGGFHNNSYEFVGCVLSKHTCCVKGVAMQNKSNLLPKIFWSEVTNYTNQLLFEKDIKVFEMEDVKVRLIELGNILNAFVSMCDSNYCKYHSR
jgi:hypothetical protein